jgi:hypothetical protein
VINHHSCSKGLNFGTLRLLLSQLAHLDCSQVALNGVPEKHFTYLVGSPKTEVAKPKKAPERISSDIFS